MNKILIIDDNNDNLISISALLRNLFTDCTIITANSGIKGIEKAKKELPDTILLDVIMPEMDGYETCRLLKSKLLTKHIPIIMITAIKTDSKSLIKGLETGADIFLQKPIDKDELKAQVNVMLRIKKAEDILREKKKNLEDSVQEGKDRFYSLIESTSDGVIISDQYGLITEWNKGAENLFRYKKNEIIGKKVSVLMPEKYRSKHNKTLHQYVKSNKEKFHRETIEAEGLRKTGKTFTLELSLSTWFTKNKRYFAVIVRDITKRKLMEKSLIESEKKFRSLIEQSNDAIYLLYNNKFEIINTRFHELFGYTIKECQEHDFNFLNLVAPKSIKLIEDRIERKKRGEDLKTVYEFTAINKEKVEIACEVSVSYINYKGGTAVQGVIRDISERIKMEKEQQNLQEQLIQAQKMEAIGTLAGGIAHDFNNILGVIMGYTELTMIEPISPDKKKMLGHVMKASERAKEMVKQILTFSRKSKESMGPVNFINITKEAISFLRSSIPTTIEIRSRIDTVHEVVFGNATQINQILMNLCTNAAHAMKEEGGVLEINIKEVFLDTDSVKVFDLEPGTYLQLIINDTGCGIDKKSMVHIFEPYYSTKKSDEGTGLGLSVVYGIIRSHKGEIKVYSEPGIGTVFNVYFPVFDTESKEDLKTSLQNTPMGNNEKILFVDDEISLAELGKTMLINLGYFAESRTSSIEALEAFRANQDKYDLIITDMTMPNVTGVKLAGEIHKIRPEIPVILCTGFSSTINKNNIRDHGIDALIMKPIIQKDFATIINEVLNRKKGMDKK